MAAAERKAEVALETYRLLGVPSFCFHDRDAAPERASLAESVANLERMADRFARKMERAKVRLL
ncbi:MAG: hypothetical protein ACOCYN_03920 [Planctomycetota bacterium]